MSQPTTTTTTTTVITGTPVYVSGGVVTGTPVSNQMIPGVPTLQIQTPQASGPQVPPPGFGFPFPDYDGKSDVPAPPSPDNSQSSTATSSSVKPQLVDESKSGSVSTGEEYITTPPKDLQDPSKIDFDYSRPPSEVPYFANQMKQASSGGSDSSGGMGGMSSSSSSSATSSGSSGSGGMGGGMGGGGMGGGTTKPDEAEG